MRCPTRSFALLLCIIPAVLGSAVSSRKNHFKRSYSYTCANLSGQELIVQESDGSSYDAGAIGGCACASQTWVENNLSGNPDPAIYNAEQEVGLDETVSVVSGMVSFAGLHSVSPTNSSGVGDGLFISANLQLSRPCLGRLPSDECLQLRLPGWVLQVRFRLRLPVPEGRL